MTLSDLRRRIWLATGLLVLPVAVAAQAVFHGVGDLPGGLIQSDVRHATKVGGVVIAVGTSAVNPQSPGSDASFLWTSTDGMIALPNLAPNLTGTSAIIASAITPDGRYIASRARFTPNNPAFRRAVRVTRDGLVNLDLGALPGNPQNSVANAISNDGSVLYGFARYNEAGNTQAVRYTVAGPTITAIPFPLEGDNISGPVGRGTSADGSVMVGTSTNSAIDGGDFYGPGNRAFRYVHGAGVSLVPLLTGGTWSLALALSPDGNRALAVSDTPNSPFGEAYLHDANAGTVTSLGTPAAGWSFSNTGGVTADASVIAATLGDGTTSHGFIRNAAGWHDVKATLLAAGVDLTGWSATAVNGMSADGTLLWGSGTHNGRTEGWVAEFPAGYLAGYAGTQPLTTIVGAWGDARAALVFLNDGHYFHIAPAAPNAGPDEFDGFERGTYTWGATSKAFAATTLQDTNGTIGLSELNGQPGTIIDGTADLMTVRFPGTGRPEDLLFSVARSTGTSPIVGAWFVGNAALPDRSAVIVFRDDGTYLMAQDGDSSVATGDPSGRDGMEFGTYTWNPATGAFTAAALTDTNGQWGLSHPKGTTTVTVAGDILTLTDSVEGSTVVARVKYNPLVPVAKPNYQGVWWNAPPGSESGWGINFAHQGDTIFATWFTYGADGKPLWLIAVLQKTPDGTYAGPVSTVTGPPYDSVPFDSSKIVESVVGTMTLTFAGNDSATMAYSVNGIAQTRTIVRQIFASPVPTCVWGAQADLALVTNFQDMWWNYPAGSESGWGINFAHQGDIIFATWFTYGADGRPLWFIVVANRIGGNAYAGPVSTVTGPPLYSVPFDPALVVESVVGSATLTFADGNRATFDYTVNGTSQSKQITRQVFNTPGTVCY